MENFFPAHIYLRIQCGRRQLFFTSEGGKKKDAERDFTFHIYFALMDTVCSRTTQTSKEAGGKIACCNLAGEKKSKQGRELRCDVKTSYFLYSNLL